MLYTTLVSYFTEFIGNQAVVHALQTDIAKQNVSQAYLLCGPKAVGKRTLAKELALALLTKNTDAEGRKTIEREAEKMTHSDLIVLDTLYQHGVQTDWDYISEYSNAPQAHRKKNQTKSDTISIDDVRALQDVLYETPTGDYKICIITRVNRLNTAAANALLKILEEPPPHLVFILTAERCSQLLPTITSRSRILNLQPVDTTTLLDSIDTKDESLKQFIVHVAQGAPGVALQLQEDSDAVLELKKVHANAKRFWQSGSAKERLEISKPLLDGGTEATVLLKHLALTLQESPHSTACTAPFLDLCEQLQTNAYKPLIVYNFIQSL